MRDGCWAASGRGVVRQKSAILQTLLLTLLFVAALILLPAPPAGADEPGEVAISLTRLTPSVATSDSTITFQGTVTNTGDRPLVRPQATIWRSLSPLTSRSELDAAAESAPTDPVGERMYSADTPNAFQDLYTDDQPDLDPGRSVSFRLSTGADAFFDQSTPSTGVYLTGVQVRENGVVTVGRSRTYLPAAADDGNGLQPGQQKIGTSTLVELSSAPSMTRTGVFADDHLAAELAPGGRLDALLTAAEEPDAGYLIDPDLITELRSMRSGYRVVDADGKSSTGPGKSRAAGWLSRFATLQSDHDGYQMLYAHPDLPSLVHGNRLQVVRNGQQAAQQVAETHDLPLLINPADGAADRETLHAAQRLGARAILLADTTVDGLGPVVKTANSPTILSYDTEGTTGPGPEPRDTPVQLRQNSLADTYIDSISGEDPHDLGRLRVVSDTDDAGSETAVEDAPWLQSRSVSDLLTDAGTALHDRLTYPDSARADEFTARQLDRISGLGDDLATYQHLLVKPGSLTNLALQAPARAASSSWRGHRRPMNAYVTAQRRLLTTTDGKTLSLDDLIDGDAVRVESNAQVTLTGSSARVPATVVNTLDATVSVGLVASSANQSRLRLDDVTPGVLGPIGPGERVPVQIPAHADANGELPVTLQLQTRQSESVGRPTVIAVNATQAGLVGWVIAVAAGIVLLGTVVLRIRQVARERGDSDEEADTPDGDSADRVRVDENGAPRG